MAEKTPKLPSWATWDNGQVIVDMDVVYPKYLDHLELDATQFSTGVVKLCITRDVRDIIDQDVAIRFRGSDTWKLENLPAGAGTHDDGLKAGGKYRDRIIQKRAAQALAIE